MSRTKTVSTKVYRFDELSERAKERALDKLAQWACEDEWWSSVYEDAESVGIEDIYFDLTRGTIGGKLVWGLRDCLKAIADNHGESCDTFKTAKRYEAKLEVARAVQRCLDPDEDFDGSELGDEFLHDILEDYSTMLRAEYEYLTSREALLETIECNEYEFTEEGEIA